jgi:hypothetical protein
VITRGQADVKFIYLRSLKAGDRVVSSGAALISEGELVEVIP